MQRNKKRVAHLQEEKQSVEAVCEQAEMLDLLDQDFISTILNMFRELNKTMELRRHQIENINNKIEIIFKQEFWSWKLQLQKKSLDGSISIFEQTEERIGKFEIGLIKIIQSDLQREKTV